MLVFHNNFARCEYLCAQCRWSHKRLASADVGRCKTMEVWTHIMSGMLLLQAWYCESFCHSNHNTTHNFNFIWAFGGCMSCSCQSKFDLRPPKIIVWLSSTTFCDRCGQADFFLNYFSKIKVKATLNYSLLTSQWRFKYVYFTNIFLHTSLNQFSELFRCKQIDYKNFKTVNLKPENSKKKKKETVWNSEN